MATYETNVNNNNNVYDEEVDNSSETSKDNSSSSSASSFIDETKKIIFEDNKEERNLSSSKRNKRNSFISMFNPKKDDKDKEEKEKHSESLTRSLSAIFSKDKRNNTVESEKRPTSRNSSNSDPSKGLGFVFYSDDEEKLENDTTPKKGKKSRQNSNAESLEKEKSSKKINRLSVNLGKLFESKSSSKPKNMFDEDSFLEPGETTVMSPTPLKKKDKKNNDNNNNNNSNNNNNNNYSNNNDNNNNNNVKSHDSIIGNGSDNTFSPKSSDDSPVDDIQSSISSTQQSSFDDQEISSNNNVYNIPETPTTPRLIVTPTDPESASFDITNNSNNRNQEDKKEDTFDQNNVVNSIIGSKSYETKERNFVPLTISTNIIQSNFIKRKSDDTITNTVEQEQHEYDSNNTKALQDLEDINKSLNNVREQLEAKVAEQNIQITKFNSMEHIMQQQVDLSKRMTETMQRLESKVNVQKDEADSTSISKIFEETIKRLESKIDRQNDEITRLKSVVGQLSGESQQLLLTNGDISRLRITQGEDQNLIVTRKGELVPQSPQIYSRGTLVSTLVVNPLYNTITVSASIATSVLYAVYVRPVVGLVSVLRDGISTNCETTE